MNTSDNHPVRGGILVRTDRDDPTQGWLEMTVPISELRLSDNPNGTAESMVSIFFDYQSGSICELARIITEAHGHFSNRTAERTWNGPPADTDKGAPFSSARLSERRDDCRRRQKPGYDVARRGCSSVG